MKAKVYVETSVISYLSARSSRDLVVAAHQEITRHWWDNERSKYDLYISEAVVREAGEGDPQAAAQRIALLEIFPILDINSDVEMLPLEILVKGAIPPAAALDALHIAVAVWHGANYLLTWNCRRITSALVRPRIDAICRARGIASPQLCTPEELMEA